MKSCFSCLIVLCATASSAVAGNFSLYTIGNSLTGDLFVMFPAFGGSHQTSIGGTYSWGAHYHDGTNLNFVYNNPQEASTSSSGTRSDINLTSAQFGVPYGHTGVADWNRAPWNTALPGNHWDAVAIEPFPGAGNTLATDTTAINGMIAATRSNPSNALNAAAPTNIYIYAAWPSVIYDTAPITPTHTSNANTRYLSDFSASTPNTPSEPSILNRSYFHDITASVRQTYPETSVVPVGEVLYTLTQKMMNNEFDDYYSIDQIHRDGTHMNSVGQNIVSWATYATIFKTSPVGLGVEVRANGLAGSFTNETVINDHDRLLMQQTIWDVVTQQSFYTNVPEPTTGGMILGSLFLLGARRRK